MQPHPIQFLREPDDHFTLPRADIAFVCSSTIFNGFPNISWFFNNTVIKAGPHYIIDIGQTTSTLTIKNVSTEDQGEYHCCISEWKTKLRSRSGQLFSKKLDYINQIDVFMICPCILMYSSVLHKVHNYMYEQTQLANN